VPTVETLAPRVGAGHTSLAGGGTGGCRLPRWVQPRPPESHPGGRRFQAG